jgi:hypothetical protein
VVKKYKVNPSTRMFRLYNLMDNSVYLVCIITQVFMSPGRQYFEDELLKKNPLMHKENCIYWSFLNNIKVKK